MIFYLIGIALILLVSIYMNKINCNANNCSHNSNGVCYANRINVPWSQWMDK